MIWWGKLFHTKLSIVFPAYNEAENIRTSIEGALPFIHSHDAEIIVVDDGSQDTTAARVLQLQQPRVRLISHAQNRGYGAALRTGFLQARGEWIFFTDADLQFDLAQLHLFWQHKDAYDLIIGYRSPRKDPLHRRIYGRMWRALVNYKCGLKIRDINCAFKLMRRECVQARPILASGASINAELLYHLKSKRILQLPVLHQPRTKGVQTGAQPDVIMRALWELWQLQ